MMKMIIRKRLIPFILAIILLVGMFPVAVFSEEPNPVEGTAEQNAVVPASPDLAEQASAEPAVESTTVYRAFDISIRQAGEELPAEGRFKVSVATGIDNSALIPEGAVITDSSCVLYHMHGDKVDVIEDAVVDDAGNLTFTTENFSTFVLVYTVDFRYVSEEDGTAYDFSIPGGGAILLNDLVRQLGMAKDDPDTEADEIASFVANIRNVSFSDQSLVWVGRAESDTTVGTIKDAHGLNTEYSSEVTEEEREAADALPVRAGEWVLISLLPFTTEETLTLTMADGSVITVTVTDAQIKKTVIGESGEAWEITVTYDDDADIPEGAELKVREILPGDEEYDDYYRRSLEKVGAVTAEEEDNSADGETSTGSDYAHIFDIQIWADDREIQPASDVSVSIKLLDAPEDESVDLKVVHFGTDGPEVMDAENEKETEAGIVELSFVTNEFSVYTVVNAGNTNLNGQSFALVSGIANDPGATTGYNETWGQDYFTIIVNAHAVMDRDNIKVVYDDWAGDTSGLDSKGVHLWTDNTGSYVGGDATQWYFESAGNGYKIYSLDDNTRKYIYQINNGASVGLTTNSNSATIFSMTPNTDGSVLIHNGNWYLHNNANPAEGWNEWVGRNYIMTYRDTPPTDNDYNFKLCKYSEAFDSFAAQKVAASEITTNTNYIIYRKFEDELGNETLYALAHDGTFVRVYDGGDTIYWRETDKNLYWNYQLNESGYPVVFTRDLTTNSPIYINPSHSASQTLSTTATGLTLLGRDNGEYSTAIECWDQAAYDYAGLHVTQNGEETASLTTGTRIAETSDKFLFAVASQMPGGTAEQVATVDSDSLGIKITMFDYGNANGISDQTGNPYNAGDKLPEMTNIAGSDEYTPHAAHALVKPYLESGLPSSISNGAMTGLFSSGGAITYSRTDVNHLFLQSYYNENGTFRYRSEDNYAYLGLNGATDFKVYRQAATPFTTNDENSGIVVGRTYYHHGHFMPFNDIDMNNNLSRLMNQYGNAYIDGEAIGEIPLGDGRTYEDIYGIQGTPNFYTGMKIEANFTQPRNGKMENGDDMIFKFTGDDDMWVYIDDVLVLDIGGIHEPLSGVINFATGEVSNPAGSSLAGTTTLYQIFQNVLTASGTPQNVKDKINAISWKDVNGDGVPDTFADYTNHSISAFYMERGAGASNLDIQFNLKVVLKGEFSVEKEIPDGIDPRFGNEQYKFRATYLDGNVEKPLHAGIENVCSAVVYKDKVDEHGDPVNVPVDNDGYFYLKPGEIAVFKMQNEHIQYNVREVGINSDLISEVEINGTQVNVTDGTAEAGAAYANDRSHVLYTNHPKTQNLLITKHISEEPAPMEKDENPVFEFRVYLETIEDSNGSEVHKKLVPYSYAPYYLIKEIGNETHYFTLTGENNAPVDRGTDPVVCSTTGRSGSINSIPPEYTIVIPNLVVGTNFYVEERRDNIPNGYEFVKEELTSSTYDPSNLGTTQEIIDRVLARDETDHQVFDPDTVGRIKSGVDAESHVYNKKTTVIVNADKQWLSASGQPVSPPENATVTFELYADGDATGKTVVLDGKTLADEINANDALSADEKEAAIAALSEEKSGEFTAWKAEWRNLPKYKNYANKPLVEISYTVKEVSGYRGFIDQNPDGVSSGNTITNKAGTELPATGGSGTVRYVIIGGGLMLAAGALLLARKRRKDAF